MADVGVIYAPAHHGWIERAIGHLDVIEVEPQTLWLRDHRGALRLDERAFAQLETLVLPRMVHGVGLPLAASVAWDPALRAPWRESLRRLNPKWVSEHLAFMQLPNPNVGNPHSGFLLPPLQTRATQNVALRRIEQLREWSAMPVAFEIAPNYLAARSDEQPDGEFFAEIAERADCGIVLDLHNLWCNQLNGRASVESVLAALPLHRVWEIHLAGGELLDGYWLDAHSDLVAPELIALCQQWLPRMPNVQALIFEIMPEAIAARGIDQVALEQQLIALQTLAQIPQIADSLPRPAPVVFQTDYEPRSAEVERYEIALGHAVNRRGDAIADPAIALYIRLIESFRAGALVAGLPLTTRLLMLTLGDEDTNMLLRRCWQRHWPSAMASDEVAVFIAFLMEEIDLGTVQIPNLSTVLAFEHDALKTALGAAPVLLELSDIELKLLTALSRGQLPADLSRSLVGNETQ